MIQRHSLERLSDREGLVHSSRVLTSVFGYSLQPRRSVSTSRIAERLSQFVGANIQEVSRSDANALVIETGITYPLIEDPTGQLYAFFGGISMPTTVFIDAAGNIVDTHSGVIFKDDLEVKIREVFGL